MLQIVIHNSHKGAPRLAKSAQDGVVLPRVLSQANANDMRAAFTQFLNCFPAVIGASIIDQNKLVRPSAEGLVYLPSQLLQTRLAVVYGNHHAQLDHTTSTIMSRETSTMR